MDDQTTAIVIRRTEWSETSLIVQLFTRDFGRMSAIAKGARRVKSPFEGSLDLLSVCRIVAIRKQTDALNLLTEAKLHRRFRGGQRSLDRLYAGYTIAEWLRLMTDHDDPHVELYDRAINALGQIDGTGDVAATLLWFELQMFRILGHGLSIDRCAECGRTFDGDPPRPMIAIDAGGIVCDDCRSRHRNVAVTPRTLQAMRYLASPDTRPPVRVADDVYAPLRAVLSRYLPTLVETTPRMGGFQPSIRGD